MTKRITIAALLCAMGLAAISRAEYAPNIRLDHNLDRFIYRLAARYHIDMPRGMLSQPMNAADINAFLAVADSLAKVGALSKQEVYHLEKVRAVVLSERSLYSWQAKERDVHANLHLSLIGSATAAYRLDDGSDSLFASGTFSPELRANAGRVSFNAGVDVATDYRNTMYPASSFEPYDGVPYTLYGRADSANFRAIDMPRAGVVCWWPHVTLETGVDQLKLGPAVYSPVVLSGEAPPITYLRGRLDLGLLDYEHAVGLLRADRDKTKYIYEHRVEVPVRRWGLTVGVEEVTITGSTVGQVVDSTRPVYYPSQSRGLEWVYLIPFVPFAISEHYLGDKDNSTLAFDLNLLQPRTMRWYAEFLLDDITAPWTIFSNDWGNKWALTAGCQYFGRLFSRDITATLEYCRVEPWVYTHFYGGSHNFAHFGENLGAPGGPNSDALHFGLEAEVTPRHTLGLTLSNLRKGHSRGSEITDVFQDTTSYYKPQYPDSWTKEFLGPGTTRSTQVDLMWRMAPFSRFRLETHCVVDFADWGTSLVGSLVGGWVF